MTDSGLFTGRNVILPATAKEQRMLLRCMFAKTGVQYFMSCRAGLKLEAALDHFGVDVTGLRVLDSGLSTGGFADCLLQRGAAHVVGVDVGYGQVAFLALITVHAELALKGPCSACPFVWILRMYAVAAAETCIRCTWPVGPCKVSGVISERCAYCLSKSLVCMHHLDCPFRICWRCLWQL